MKCKSVNVNKKFELIGHGENSITYQLFNVLDKHKLFRLLKNTVWIEEPILDEEDIEEVHLFPGFGKAHGYGEPDVIILAKSVIVYVEVEMDNLNNKLKDDFVAQIQRFAELGVDIFESNRKQLVRDKFEGRGRNGTRRAFLGRRRLRSLFKKIKSKPKKPFLLVISDSREKDVNVENLKERMEKNAEKNEKLKKQWDLNKLSLGWISFKKIKQMRGMKPICTTIDYNLEK